MSLNENMAYVKRLNYMFESLVFVSTILDIFIYLEVSMSTLKSHAKLICYFKNYYVLDNDNLNLMLIRVMMSTIPLDAHSDV